MPITVRKAAKSAFDRRMLLTVILLQAPLQAAVSAGVMVFLAVQRIGMSGIR
ncbi:MAG: hypothetical protein HZB31_05770 [Nitrospirae bacterium]|nr:hypothetical protein [Nitrospirota bacterium]